MSGPPNAWIRCCRSRATSPTTPPRVSTLCRVRNRCRPLPMPATTRCRKAAIPLGHGPASTGRSLASGAQFFEDNGFRLDEHRPQTGEFNTTWQRSTNCPHAVAKRMSSQLASPPTAKPASACVSSRACSAIPVKSMWSAPSVLPAALQTQHSPIVRSTLGLDAVLVDDMLASMSRTAEKGGSVSLLAARDFDTPSRVSLSEDGSGNPVLNLGADLDRAWSSVGRALKQGEWRVEDINRSLGLYYINLAEKAEKKETSLASSAALFGSEPSQGRNRSPRRALSGSPEQGWREHPGHRREEHQHRRAG